MSAIGTKRTCVVALHMSAFGGKADMAMSALEELIERHGIGAKFMKMLDSIFGASAPRCASIYPIPATSRCALSFLGWVGESPRRRSNSSLECSETHMLVFAGPCGREF